MKTRAGWTLPLVLVLASCGEDGGPVTSTANRAPTVDAFQNPEGDAIVGVTTLTFSAFALDPDGDAVTCSWNLGDGTPRTGTRAARSYQTAGTFPASVTCTDGRGGSVTAGTTVIARNR